MQPALMALMAVAAVLNGERTCQIAHITIIAQPYLHGSHPVLLT